MTQDRRGDKNLSRRDLFSLFRRPVEAVVRPAASPPPASAPAGAPAAAPPSPSSWPAPLRPPGAAPELLMADTCLRCGACVEICPRQAIRPLPETYGAWAGTPHIVPRQAPCVLCHGLVCTTVCPSGALRPVTVISDVQMGLAVLDTTRCLPYQGQPCRECQAHCPVESAITLTEGRPQVTSACTGCGLCENYCPTQPSSIRVRPREADRW